MEVVDEGDGKGVCGVDFLCGRAVWTGVSIDSRGGQRTAFHQPLELTLSVAIFIHSSKLVLSTLSFLTLSSAPAAPASAPGRTMLTRRAFALARASVLIPALPLADEEDAVRLAPFVLAADASDGCA